MAYVIGLDYGTNSVRCVLVDTADGREIAQSVYAYESGESGILLDSADRLLARQNPADYLKGLWVTVQKTLQSASQKNPAFDSSKIIGIGVDTTGSTPIPLDVDGKPLASHDEFKDNLNACVWLWKDHSSYAEAEEITILAKKEHPEYLAKCGGAYSPEWFFSKILHCIRGDPAVAKAAYTWAEHVDWMTGVLTGNEAPGQLRRCRCAAGHKAMFHSSWGGYPAEDFLAKLDPELARIRRTLPAQTDPVGTRAGLLTKEWAEHLGLPEEIPVAVGALDAHMGAIGSGVREGTLVKILGTSTCDLVVSRKSRPLPDIPGISGIAEESVLPGFYGLEAGQAAVGDLFNWFVHSISRTEQEAAMHVELTEAAIKLRPGQSGLLALDWNNGNRNILSDQRLTGLLVGQTLSTRPEEIYRALIEATAFGALTIIQRMQEYGVEIREIVNCGGIAEKSPLVMQIYADILGREMKISRSSQSCALGAAIAAAVAAGESVGGYTDFATAQKKMTDVKKQVYSPIPAHQKVYAKLYALYMLLHDAFGTTKDPCALNHVMKELMSISAENHA